VSVWFTSRLPAKYASHVTFYVQTSPGGITNQLQADQSAQIKVNSFVQLLTSQGLAKKVVGQPGVGKLSAGQIASRISPSNPVNTVILKATVTDTDPQRALAIAAAIAHEFPAMISSLNIEPKQLPTKLAVVEDPSSPTQVGPHKTLYIGMGVLVGLAFGLALAFLRELTDTSLRTQDAVEAIAGAPVIGSITTDKSARRTPVITEAQVRSRRAESYRQIRTNLQFVDVDNPVKVIVVTSSIGEEGKSTTAINLAVVCAEAGQRVLLIEADLRRPRVADYLGVERAVGLTNVLAGRVSVDEVIQEWVSGRMSILASGSIPPNPSELLGSQNMRQLIADLRQRFDLIIIDTPPLLPVTDAAVATALADGVVIVVRHAKTTRSQLAQAVKSLESVDARVIGAIVNMTKAPTARRYDGYGYYERGTGEVEATLPEIPQGVAAEGAGLASEDAAARQQNRQPTR
jgi:capsular exopolysaccharide synthesis family protein